MDERDQSPSDGMHATRRRRHRPPARLFGMFWGSSPSPPPVPDAILIPDVFFDPLVLQWAGGLMLLQVVLQVLLTLFASGALKKNAGLVAHQVCVSIPFVYSSYNGTMLLFFDDAIATLHSGTYADRLYSFHPQAWMVTRFFIGFQMYDLCATMLVPELRKLEHCAHHVLSLLTGCAGTSGPLLQYYAPFFFGFVEVSSVPLAWVDVFRAVPPSKGSLMSAANEVVRIAFAVAFLPIRCVMFPVGHHRPRAKAHPAPPPCARPPCTPARI